jgi:hypothetical protein
MVHVLLVDVNVDMKGMHVVQVCDTGDYLNIYLLNLNIYTLFNCCDTKELEDTRKLTRVRKSKKDRQHNGQKKKINIVAVIFIGRGIRNNWRKPSSCCKSLTNFIT